MAKYYIDNIEGIEAVYSERLHECSINTTVELLDYCAGASGRKSLSKLSGIDEKDILKWTNMADLMRIRGIGEEYSELLEAAGVDTIKELRHRKAENLFNTIREVNLSKQIVKQTPPLKSIKGWIEQAKSLAPKLTY